MSNRVVRLGAAIALLVGCVAADCTVPANAYWGDFVVSDCGVGGTTVAQDGTCVLTCAPPAEQYDASATVGPSVTGGSVTITCLGTGEFEASDFTCIPANGADLGDISVWCGSATATYINGYTYLSSEVRVTGANTQASLGQHGIFAYPYYHTRRRVDVRTCEAGATPLGRTLLSSGTVLRLRRHAVQIMALSVILLIVCISLCLAGVLFFLLLPCWNSATLIGLLHCLPIHARACLPQS